MKNKNNMMKAKTNDLNCRSVLKKWGNSQGIRIPKKVLEVLNFVEGDEFAFSVDLENNAIILTEVPRKKLKLETRLEAFYNQPLEEIIIDKEPEYDWGMPKGKEIW